jgi:hypothetical protein
MKLPFLFLAFTSLLSATGSAGAGSFRPLLEAIHAEMRREAATLAVPERQWLDALIADSAARFENWPRDPSLHGYLDRLDRHSPRIRALGHFYLHTCLDLPRSLAASFDRHPIPRARAAAIFRRSDAGIQRIFAGAVDLGRGGWEARLYGLFHSRSRADALFHLLTDRVTVWRLSSWLNAQALDEAALRRSFDEIAEPVLRSGPDPIRWIERLTPPSAAVPLHPPAREIAPLPAVLTEGAPRTADFRALYADSTNLLRRLETRLAPAEADWLESLIQGFLDLFEVWPRDPSLQPYLARLDEVAATGSRGRGMRLMGHVYLHLSFDLPRGIPASLDGRSLPAGRAAAIFRLPNPDYRRLFGEQMGRRHGGPGLRAYRIRHGHARAESMLRLLADRVIVWRLAAWINGEALSDPAARTAREAALRRSFDRAAAAIFLSRDPLEWLARLDPPSAIE